MTRRTVLTAAVAAAPLAAALAADPPSQRQDGPTVDQLINLAEHGSSPQYYGRLLAACLEETGTIAKDNGDGTISLYSPEDRPGAWRKRTVRSSMQPIPADLVRHIKPANRGQDFPAGVGYTPLH
jgi:hypothetical protein